MNRLRKLGEEYFLELTGTELTGVIPIKRGEDTYIAYASIEVPSAQEEKDIRRSLTSSDNECQSFIDKRFIKFHKVQPDDRSAHVQYINNLPFLKRFMYEETFQGLSNDPTEQTNSESLPEDNSLICVPTKQLLFDPEDECEVMFKANHYLRHKSEVVDHFSKVFRSASLEEGELILDLDLNLLAETYNESVVSIDKFLIKGKACLEDNKSEWLPKVQFEHKLLVVDEAFGQAQLT